MSNDGLDNKIDKNLSHSQFVRVGKSTEITRIKNVISGKRYEFRNWTELKMFLQKDNKKMTCMSCCNVFTSQHAFNRLCGGCVE